MLNALFSSPKVNISLEEEQLFVHPIDADYPTPDPVLKGTVIVNLPSVRKITRFQVLLEGLCDVAPGAGHNAYETSTALRKELVTEFHGEEFDAGAHHFNFSFIIPSSTAVNQRSIHGRVRYYVKAVLDFQGALYPSASSAPIAVWITANPSPPGEPPLPTDLIVQHFDPDLGAVGLHVSSPHLTVSALCNLRVSLLGPPQPVTIKAIKGYIQQTFALTLENRTIAKPKPSRFELVKVDERSNPCPTIHKSGTFTFPAAAFLRSSSLSSCSTNSTPPLTPVSSSSAGPSSRPSTPSRDFPPSGFSPILSKSSSMSSHQSDTQSKAIYQSSDKPVADPIPLASLPKEQEFRYSRICRVPNDDHVRPSTLKASEGRIRVSHSMIVEIWYKVEGGNEEKILTITKPLTIASCCCLLDSLYLPSYSQCSVQHVHQNCMCTVSLKEAFDRDGEALQRAGEIEPVREGGFARLIGAEGEEIDRASKTPAWSSVGNEIGSPSPSEEKGLSLG
ncbi:hypothetical protein JCM5353_007836 [Sporobolomyces roseus]